MTGRFDAAVAAIDEVNAADPVRITVDGVERAKELVHADLVEHWVRTLDPAADELQLLAARAHHLRRWTVPRSDYPDGRAGYLRWRTDQKKRQSSEVGDILLACGYDADEIVRVGTIVAKRHLATDPAVQTHEDALCLAFLQLQFDALADQLGDDHMIEVVRKTVAKMSSAGVAAAAASITMSEHGAEILRSATS